ncbi:MAG: hypothetical protein B6U94_05680 [Thermofilum sp. ex4484_79]|nr:MAG: hypothetical protein B6U94_05680 [Thermofilum sp. ex4484_79]
MEDENKACWQYLNSGGIKFPILSLLVISPIETQSSQEIFVRIDTGYDGFLLSEEKYRRMGFYLSELPREYWPEEETVTGEVFRLRRAWTIVEIPKLNIRIEGHVDTFRGNTDDLAGLKLIENLKLLLDGPAQTACIIF